MDKQMHIFDFIEKPPEPDKLVTKSLFERHFTKIYNPLMQCVNCLCERCINNVEEMWSSVQPVEQKFPCFNCDECLQYTGKPKYMSQRKEDCTEFEISDYAATTRRKKMKLYVSIKKECE